MALRRFPLSAYPVRIVLAPLLVSVIVSADRPAAAQVPARGDDPSASASVRFDRDVKPILRRHCDRCHGSKNQEAGLQLNRRDDALDPDWGIVVPGDADESLLITRLTDPDAGDLMPLDGQPLSAKEIDLLSRWIDQGAEWPESLAEPTHWAYEPLSRPPTPVTSATSESVPPADDSSDSVNSNDSEASAGRSSHTAHPIDAFVAERLADEGLAPAPPEAPARLLRRVSLALTGLPPTTAETERFLADRSAGAYERVVDRLLQSQRFGERWAVPWLDLARYADSNGFQADQIRDNWAYRDWLIGALNDDMPFDRFVIEQLAGDLLPDATVDQRVATGFHRMTTCNVEAGVDPEANRVNQVVDRVNTTATVFMGTTLECAQCHDHKYDPFSQEDYYRLFAYFNNTPIEVKQASGVRFDFNGPSMELPLERTEASRRSRLQARIGELQSRRQTLLESGDTAFQDWLVSVRQAIEADGGWRQRRPDAFQTSGDESFEILDDGAVLLSGDVPEKVTYTFTFDVAGEAISGVRIDALTDDAIPGGGPGRGDPERTNVILNELVVEAIGAGEPRRLELTDPVADFSQQNWDVTGAIDGDPKSGWAFSPRFGKPHWARFTLTDPIRPDDGVRKVRIRLIQNFGKGRVYGKPKVTLHHGDRRLVGLSEEALELLSSTSFTPTASGASADANAGLSGEQLTKLRKAFDQNDPRLREIDKAIAEARQELKRIEPDTTLVMVELDSPRDTFVMQRGDYESPGERVEPGTPSVLPRDDSIGRTGDRLELARWLTSPSNPLLPRVTVNRWWAELFGTGIVSTPEDFGSQAESPSHPGLLDWLACELIDSGWSMKHVLKQIVMSSTFRQSSRVSSEVLAADPDNRWLARGPRFRLTAEFVRDNALAISGLLSDRMTGAPVMPFQPDGLWRSVGRNQPKWVTAADADRFRRGVYVVFKRAAPYPSFVNFDAPDRASCTVQRPRTNTPLQALTLLNDPAYAEMALAFADRVLRESPGDSDRERLDYAFRLAVTRPPTANEIDILSGLLRRQRETLAGDADAVQRRTEVPFGGWQPETADRDELAAWFAVTNALLNLDETMSL